MMKAVKFLSLLFLCCLMACPAPPRYDWIIRHGLVYDGSGVDPYQADIALVGERIVAVGDLSQATAPKETDATDLAIAPGFIDLHAHLDPIMRMPEAGSHIRQGVTTALGGPDGGGIYPLGPYLDSLETLGTGMNIAYLIGHNVIRRKVMGMADRAPNPEELVEMKSLVKQGMLDGAFGLSTGLKYLPGAFSETEEVIALSRVATAYGGFYTSHLREEGLGLIEGVQEAIQIGKEANIPIVLTHHKAIGQTMWGASKKTLAMVDSARAAGIQVRQDQYPYTASYTGIAVLIPAWALADGPKAFARRAQDPKLRERLHEDIVFNLIHDRGGGDLRRIQFSRVVWKPELEGKTLHDWALMEGLEPDVNTGARLVIAAQLKGGASCIFFAMDQGDVDRIMQHPQTMIASDGRLSQHGFGMPHPRNYGTFPRVLGHYARDRKVLPLKTAVHKMTGLPAEQMGLKDRGLIRADYYADLVLFDPATVLDQATFTQPHQYPMGIHFVIVNGTAAVESGTFKGTRTGKVLRGPGAGKSTAVD